MKVGVLGDTHFGYGYGTELEEDSYSVTKQALDKLIAAGADIILVMGDIFDVAIPRQEVLSRAADILTTALLAKNTGIKLVQTINKNDLKEPLHLRGVPLIAIHGTHDRRPRGFVNPVQALDKAGIFIHIHNGGLVLEKDGEKVAVQAIGGIPESYASEAFRRSGLKPVPNAFNIFMFHQTIKPYVYTPESVLEAGDLPNGFDLYVNGHIHWGFVDKHPNGSPILFSGSILVTQMKDNEVEGKRVWIVDTKTKEITPIPLETRPFFYMKVTAGGRTPNEIMRDVERAIESKIVEPKPLIKVIVEGRLAPGFKAGDLPVTQFTRKYADHAFVSVDRKLDEEAKVAETVEVKRKSVDEAVLETIQSLIKERGLTVSNLEELYPLLIEGKEDAASEVLLK